MCIRDSLATVLETAMEYAGQGVMLSDLVQEGNIALMLSLESLNAESPDMGQDVCEEQVCAAIRSSMQETLEEQELLKSANDTIVTKVNLISQGVSNLTEELDRKVTVEELAAYLLSLIHIWKCLYQLLWGQRIRNRACVSEKYADRIRD